MNGEFIYRLGMVVLLVLLTEFVMVMAMRTM